MSVNKRFYEIIEIYQNYDKSETTEIPIFKEKSKRLQLRNYLFTFHQEDCSKKANL